MESLPFSTLTSLTGSSRPGQAVGGSDQYTVRLEIFGSVIFSVNRERRCSVERNFRYRAHCLFEGVANVH